MAQLADVQFFGYRDILEDLEKTLVGYNPLKKARREMEIEGGLLGMVLTLQERVKTLEGKLPGDIYEIADHVISEKLSELPSSNPVPVDKEFMIPLIRNEARNVAEIVFNTKLQSLRITM